MRAGLIVHHLDPAEATGIARYSRGLAHGLDRLLANTSDEVTVVTARSCGSVSAPHHEIPVRRRYLYGSWLFLRTPRVERLTPNLDVVHVTAPVVPVPTAKPLVVTVHDLLPITHPEWYPAREVAVFRRCLRWLEDDADAVVVPTHTVRDEVLAHTAVHAERVFVTGEGVDLDHFSGTGESATLERLGLEPRRFILYVGQVSDRKNLLPLLEARRSSQWPLVIVGPDGFGAERIRTAAAHSVGSEVRFLGRVPDDVLGDLVRSARALVHPSLYEGFGLTVVEAMAMGTPALVSRGGALGEVVGTGGHVVSTNDVSGWQAALETLVDETYLGHLEERGRERAAFWRWDETARKTWDVYNRIR